MKLINLSGLVVFVLFTSIGCDGNGEGKGEVVFKPIKIVPTYHESYAGHFLFINRTKENIEFKGWDPPENGKFNVLPDTVGYEVEIDGEWIMQGYGFIDFIPKIFKLKPKKRCELIIKLYRFDRFKDEGRPIKARVIDGGFTSESFTLDWEKDRREGNFAAVKKEHIDKVRSLLLKSGFKPELIKGDDFFLRFRQSLISVADDNKFGFESFQGNLDFPPNIDTNENVAFGFCSSNEGRDYEYQYVCWLYINPSTFRTGWFRDNYKRYVKVGTWGKGRSMEFDMGSGILMERGDRLYFEIHYFPLISSGLPDEESSREFFIKILEEFGKWLRE